MMDVKFTAVLLAVMVMVATANESPSKTEQVEEASESWTGWAKDKISGGLGLKDSASQNVQDKASEAGQYGADKAYESAQSAKDKAFEAAQAAKDKAYETARSAKRSQSETVEQAEHTVDAAKDKSETIKDHITSTTSTDDEL